MLRTIVLTLLLSQVVVAQSSAPATSALSPHDAFRKDYMALQRAVEDVVETSVPGSEVLQPAKATYLDELGILVTLEVVLERPPNNPFSSPRSAAEVRMSLTERRKLLQDGVQQFLKQKVVTLQSIGPNQSLAIVVYLFNPAAVANLPAQIIFIVKKQDPTKVSIREF